MEEHGPVTPGLLDHLRRRGGEYDALVFFSYRYWTTYHGLAGQPAGQVEHLAPIAGGIGAHARKLIAPRGSASHGRECALPRARGTRPRRRNHVVAQAGPHSWPTRAGS